MHRRLPSARAALALVFAVTSCGDPTGPPDNEGLLLPGVVVSGRVEGVDQPVIYALRVSAGDEFVIHFQSSVRGLVLRVVDPRTSQTLEHVEDWTDGDELTDVHTNKIRIEEDRTLRVTVTAYPEVDFGDFRLRVTPVPRAPEARAPTVALNDTIREAIDHDFDADEFTFTGAAGDEVVAFLRADPSAGFSSMSLRVTAPDGNAVTDIDAIIPSLELEANSSGQIRLPASGRYTVRIDGWGAMPLSYAFQIRRINRAPESVPQALAHGDTVDERVDHVADVDEFLITGSAGDSFNVFLQTLGTASSLIHGEVVGLAATLVEPEPGRSLADGGTGVFTLPASGQATIRVAGNYDRYGLYRGPYRLLAYRINPAPEHSSPVLARICR